MEEIQQRLLEWYKVNKRDLPWRQTNNPYNIWISEIILQQTQVIQGTGYYHRFIERFPTVYELAKATQEEVLNYWQGLGYYSRARNLHYTAQEIVSKHSGQFPTDYKTILSLKGIGPYTAAAISSIAFNKPHAVLDGNVFRVLSRLFNIDTPINSTEGKKQFEKLAEKFLDRYDPGTFNQAVMEFGALHCMPKTPGCSTCILLDKCMASGYSTVSQLPVKLKKTKQRLRYFYFFMVVSNDKTWLIERTEKDIWKGLFQFPLLESNSPLSDESAISNFTADLYPTEKRPITIAKKTSEIKHILSHQKLMAKGFTLHIESPQIEEILNKRFGASILLKDIDSKPIPRLMELIMAQLLEL